MKKVLLLLVLILISGLVYNFSPETKLSAHSQVDSLVVFKSQYKMFAYQKGKLLKTYKVSLGDNPFGHKVFEGDEKTPEGLYSINAKNDKSGYHKNLGISYPNAQDIKYAKSIGKSPGGDIKIHGLRNGLGVINKFQRWFNWTNGCIALTNSEVDELYRAVKLKTKIQINP